MHRIILYLLIVFLVYSITVAADDASTVIVKVNGSPIMLNEVEREIDRLIPGIFFHRNVAPEKREKFRKDAIDRLIERELQFQSAKAQGIKAEKREIKDKVEEIKSKFKSNSEFKEALKKNNMTLKDMETRIDKAIRIEKVIKKEVDDKMKVGDEEIKAHYENNIQRYREMEQVKIRHIMVRFDNSPIPTVDKGGREDLEKNGKGESKENPHPDDKGAKKTRSREEARARAEELLGKIKEGEDFATLAYNYSDDPYRVKSGDLGYVHKGRIEPELEGIVFNMNVGEIKGPVEMGQGFYIIKIEDKKQERQLSFEETKDKIKKELEKKKKEEKMKEWLEGLKAKAKIEYQPLPAD